MNGKTERQFLALLGAGLWDNAVDDSLFMDGADWKAIYKTSVEQSVIGIVGDGIGKLPAGLRPRPEILLKFSGMVIAIEKRNAGMNAFIPELARRIKDKNVQFWILKGQGLARNYPEPLHRQSGDIDLLVREEDFYSVRDFLRTFSKVDEYPLKQLHCAANINGIEVELHGELNAAINSHVGRYFKAWLKEELYDAPEASYTKNGDLIPVPSPDFNAVYVFIHFFRHLLESGIGFRQVCDWMRMLYVSRNEIDYTRLKNTLKKFHLMRAWQCFGCVAVTQLGMPKEAMPFYDDRYAHLAYKITKRIFVNGNFGKNNRHLTDVPQNYFLRKCHSFYYRTAYKLPNFSIFPRETAYSLLKEWRNAIKKLFHGE